MSKSSEGESKHSWPAYIIVAVLVLFIFVLPIIEQTRFSFFGWSDGFSSLLINGGVAFGTILLALGTWMTIREMEQERQLTEELVDETEKEREITRKTINQMEKDREKKGKILTISFAIDPILNDLRDDKRVLQSDNEDCFKIPILSGWDELDWAAQADIEASDSYPDFSNDIKNIYN